MHGERLQSLGKALSQSLLSMEREAGTIFGKSLLNYRYGMT
jgi:hypothetical protein